MTEQEKQNCIKQAVNAAEYLMLFAKSTGIPVRTLLGEELSDRLVAFVDALDSSQSLSECGFEEARWPV